MHPFNKPISDITLIDIEALIDEASEARTLDFKRDLYTNGDPGKKDFLIDISALANTVGGYLIIGVEEEEGLAKKICGIEIDDFDQLKLQYENILMMSADPPIRGVEFYAIDVTHGKSVLIIEVPRSISRPHAVKHKGYFRFHGRHSGGNYPYEVSDIRQAMLESETTATKIRNFRNDRIAAILHKQLYIPVLEGAALIIHLIPSSAFEAGRKYQLTREICRNIAPINERRYNTCFNVDGYLVTEVRPDKGDVGSYTQIYHNGIVEAFDRYSLGIASDADSISCEIELTIVKVVSSYLKFLRGIGVPCPIWCGLSFLGVKGRYMYRDFYSEHRDSPKIDRDEIIIPEIQIEDYGLPLETVLRPAFDCLWNACGFERSLNYNENGYWKLTGKV